MNISASIGKLATSAVAVYKRFPLVLVFSSIVFFLVTSLIYEWNWEGLSGHRKFAIIWGVILAVPLYINFQLVREWLLAKWLWWLNVILLLAIPVHSTFMLWYELKDETEVYIQLATFIFVHGIVATNAYLKFRDEKGFWQFNSLLLLNFINSSFYVGVISIGILAGYGLINVLFNVWYYRDFAAIVAFVGSVIHPLLFLAWLPKNTSCQEKILSFDLPRFFRNLIVFILIPLSIGYLLILYVYIANALALGELPKGTIGWTVLTFTVASVFALVLVYPYRKNEDQKLVYWFSRLLPFALSPLVVFLWVAIGMRVGDYGFTPSRVLLTLLAIWLTLINAYLYTGKKWGLMPLAGVLTLLCVVAIGWPINVKSISIWSQQSIQRGVLQAYNIAEGDSVSVAKYNKLTDVDKEKLIGTNDYLENSNSSLVRLDSLIPDFFVSDYPYPGDTSNSYYYQSFPKAENLSFLTIDNNDTIYRSDFNLGSLQGDSKFLKFNNDNSLTFDNQEQCLTFTEGEVEKIFPLDGVIRKLNKKRNPEVILPEPLFISVKCGNTKYFLFFESIESELVGKTRNRRLVRFSGEIFIAK